MREVRPWIVYGNCPAGGDHTPGSGDGPWSRHCTKCGAPC
jgi:hypothetical protein